MYRRRFLFLILAGALILGLACGKKGPPVAPKPTIPPAITDLKAEVIGDKVRLTWSMPKKDNALFEGLEYFRVYKYTSHSSVDVCQGCPIPFEQLLDIKLNNPEPARVEGDRVIFHDTIKADHRYAYKVVVYHKSGGVSKDSNIAEFVTP
jgi:hypothetical protein